MSDQSEIWKYEGVTEKPILCYVNFGLYADTNELKFMNVKYTRDACLKYFESVDFVTVRRDLNAREFMDDLSTSKFVVCPPGFGIDTHRFYEAVWMGAIPIVLSSALDDMYKKFGALIVDKWEDVTYDLLQNTTIKPCDRKLLQSKVWLN